MIAEHFVGRSVSSVKNRFYHYLKKRNATPCAMLTEEPSRDVPSPAPLCASEFAEVEWSAWEFGFSEGQWQE
jgi:hypothetical protein